LFKKYVSAFTLMSFASSLIPSSPALAQNACPVDLDKLEQKLYCSYDTSLACSTAKQVEVLIGGAAIGAAAPLIFTAAEKSSKLVALESHLSFLQETYAKQKVHLQTEVNRLNHEMKDLDVQEPKLKISSADAELRKTLFERYEKQLRDAADGDFELKAMNKKLTGLRLEFNETMKADYKMWAAYEKSGTRQDLVSAKSIQRQAEGYDKAIQETQAQYDTRLNHFRENILPKIQTAHASAKSKLADLTKNAEAANDSLDDLSRRRIAIDSELKSLGAEMTEVDAGAIESETAFAKAVGALEEGAEFGVVRLGTGLIIGAAISLAIEGAEKLSVSAIRKYAHCTEEKRNSEFVARGDKVCEELYTPNEKIMRLLSLNDADRQKACAGDKDLRDYLTRFDSKLKLPVVKAELNCQSSSIKVSYNLENHSYESTVVFPAVGADPTFRVERAAAKTRDVYEFNKELNLVRVISSSDTGLGDIVSDPSVLRTDIASQEHWGGNVIRANDFRTIQRYGPMAQVCCSPAPWNKNCDATLFSAGVPKGIAAPLSAGNNVTPAR
jgi:hypothetical protein